jgi:hypothetical protein
MREELINRGFELGFKDGDNLDVFNGEKPNDYYIWLCLLQKWLRVKYDINVWCEPVESFEIYKVKIAKGIFTSQPIYYYHASFTDYNPALERGIYEALNLIKK